MQIKLETYNPNWKNLFIQEKEAIIQAISPKPIRVEHIGSTSIHNLPAKPIIDIMLGFDSIQEMNKSVQEIQSLGYDYIQEYEDLMPERRFFIKRTNNIKQFHLHAVKQNSTFWIRHLLFRKHLRTNEKDRLLYFQLKQELATIEWKDENEYAEAKTDFIRKIEQKANHLTPS